MRKTVFLIFLLFSLSLISQVHAETYNFQGNPRWTMNSANYWRFDTTDSMAFNSMVKSYAVFVEEDVFHYAIDLQIRHKNNSVVTVALKICDVNITVLEGLQVKNASYTLTQNYTMERSDTLIVKAYGRQNEDAWGILTSTYSSLFTSAGIGALFLNQSTITMQWNTIWIEDLFDGSCNQWWEFGDFGQDSFIDNFIFDYGIAEAEAENNLAVGLVLGLVIALPIALIFVLSRKH